MNDLLLAHLALERIRELRAQGLAEQQLHAHLRARQPAGGAGWRERWHAALRPARALRATEGKSG